MKNKLLFLVLVMVLIVCSFVYAEGCCLESKGGKYCLSERQGASESECSENKWFGVSCNDIEVDSVKVCEVKGCCVQDNQCMENKPMYGCGGGFNAGESCSNTPGCVKGCCELDNHYTYLTSQDCTRINGDLDTETDEVSCNLKNQGLDAQRVCCVLEDKKCERVKDTLTCESKGGDPQEFLCSQIPDRCDCQSRNSIGPGEEGTEEASKLFWFDSCGNQEDSVDVNDPIETFRSLGLTPFNGNCEEDPSSAIVFENGTYTCGNIACKDPWDNPFTDENFNGNLADEKTVGFGITHITPGSGGTRKFRYSGESWCEYMQAKVGPGLDLPGTRHYRHYCDRGVEKVDAKGNGREQICIEKIVDKQTPSGTLAMSSTFWLENEASYCINCNGDGTLDPSRIIECCNAKPSCFYAARLATYQNYYLTISQDHFNKIKQVQNKAEYLKVKLFSGDKLVREYNFEELEGSDSCSSSSSCNIGLLSPPSGTYHVKFAGKVCETVLLVEVCREDEISVGDYQFGLTESETRDYFDSYSGEIKTTISGKGVCLPLIPPTDSAFCGKFKDLSQITPVSDDNLDYEYSEGFSTYNSNGPAYIYLVDHNVFYNLPYNGFGRSSNPFVSSSFACQNTLECKPSNFETDQIAFYQIMDDRNSLCKSFGDCGFNTNLFGNPSPTNIGDLGQIVYSPEYRSNGFKENITGDKLREVEKGKSQHIKSGESMRPEDFSNIGSYIFFICPLSFLLKRNRKYFLLILLLTLVFILTSCAQDIVIRSPPPPAEFIFSAFVPPVGDVNCAACNKKISQGGLLPDNDLKDKDGRSYYHCTKELCESIGVLNSQCEFVEYTENPDGVGDPGGYCLPYRADNAPKIIFLNANYTCNSINSDGCANGNYEKSNGETTFEVKGKLDGLRDIKVNFKTIEINRGVDYPTRCSYSYEKEDEFTLKDPISTGQTGAYHTIEIKGRGKLPNPTSEPDYLLYVKCDDNTPTNYEGHGQFIFRVGENPSIGLPVISDIIPEGGHKYVKFNETTKKLVLIAQGDIQQCRWDNESINYPEMGKEEYLDSSNREVTKYSNNFICNIIGGEIYKGYRCEAIVENVTLGSNRYWFSCIG